MHYNIVLSQAYPLAVGLTQAQAKQRAKTLLKELYDNMEAGKSKRDTPHISPLDFPPDMPNLFHLQHLRLQNVEPVYSDGQVHPAKPKLVEYWKATFYHRMPCGSGTDGKTIYATTAGQYLSFTFKKIIHSLDAQLLPIYTAATRALQLPHGAVFDATTAVTYRLFGNVFLPVLRTTEGEMPMCEGAVRGDSQIELGFQYKFKPKSSRILFGIKSTKINKVIALFPFNFEEEKEDDTINYKPICIFTHQYKSYLPEDYIQQLNDLRNGFNYLKKTTDESIKKLLFIFEQFYYEFINESFHFYFVKDLDLKPGGGRPQSYLNTNRNIGEKDIFGNEITQNVTFYGVHFNPHYACIVKKLSTSEYIGGISVAVMPMGHELMHLYELALQNEESTNLAIAEPEAIYLNSIKEVYNVNIIPFITIDLGGDKYRFVTSKKRKNGENKEDWTHEDIEQLFIEQRLITLGSNINVYIEISRRVNKTQLLTELNALLKDFGDWYECYGINAYKRLRRRDRVENL